MQTQYRTCDHCGEQFIPNPLGRGRHARYCTRKCKDKAKSADKLARIVAAGLTCSHEGCDRIRRTVTADGLCSMHYRRRLRGEDLDAPIRGTLSCSVEGCERPYSCKGLCALHYGRVRQTGEAGTAELKKRPNGRIWKDESNGYVYEGRRLQHRVIMEREIGRALLEGETVHHKNGLRDDNRPENLELWTTIHRRGQRVDDLAEWLVSTYPEAVRVAQARLGR